MPAALNTGAPHTCRECVLMSKCACSRAPRFVRTGTRSVMHEDYMSNTFRVMQNAEDFLHKAQAEAHKLYHETYQAIRRAQTGADEPSGTPVLSRDPSEMQARQAPHPCPWATQDMISSQFS